MRLLRTLTNATSVHTADERAHAGECTLLLRSARLSSATTSAALTMTFQREVSVWKAARNARRLLLGLWPASDGTPVGMVHLALGDQLAGDVEGVATPHRVVQPPNPRLVTFRRH